MKVVQRDGKPVIVLPPDRRVTGFSSNGKHITYHGKGWSSKIRQIRAEEKLWATPLLVTILSLLMVMSLSTPNSALGPELYGATLGMVVLGFMLFLGSIGTRFYWSEILLLGVSAQICSGTSDSTQSEFWLTILAGLGAFISYALLWIKRALWESAATTAFFLSALVLLRSGFLPTWSHIPVFAITALFSLVCVMCVLSSTWNYQRGRNNLSDY